MGKHTKWVLGITEGKAYIKDVADFDRIEDAELAVKAVNNHDALVELLNYVIKEIENTPDKLSDALLGLIKIKAKTALAQVEKWE